jgi:hypothetical protein
LPEQELAMSEWMSRNNESMSEAEVTEAEVTLRMLARLPAPQGLEDRVRAGLKAAPKAGRVLAWSSVNGVGHNGWASTGWMRGAAAAAIVFVVAGGGIGIYSRVQSGAGSPGASPRLGGFGEGGAVVRPKTVQGPVIPTAPALSVIPKSKQEQKLCRRKPEPR